MRVETIVMNEKRNVTLTCYLQEVGGEFRYVQKRPAILVLPGGGYQFCSDREADPVALPYMKAGYQAFILRYSVKEDAKWPQPLEDYEEAIELIRKNADEWNLFADKVAVIGFSAGGHLAAAAAGISKNRPNAAILGYPVSSSDVKDYNPSAPDINEILDDKTCPCFIFATRTDNVVPVMNSVKLMEALTNKGLSFESHIYSYGPHGFSTADTSVESAKTKMSSRVPNWVPDSIGWLKEVLGEYGDGEMTEPVVKSHITDDYEGFLSVNCTIGRIAGNPEGARVLAEVMELVKKNLPPEFASANNDNPSMVNNMKLADIMDFANIQAEEADKINEKLKVIPNI